MRDSDKKNEAGSPPRKGRNSHSEQTDEAPGLIEKEEVEIEREINEGDAFLKALRDSSPSKLAKRLTERRIE